MGTLNDPTARRLARLLAALDVLLGALVLLALHRLAELLEELLRFFASR